MSQAEHALQAAELAEREGAPDRLVVAALLHDVGHLLDGQDEDLADRGVDGRHEEAGCAWLARHFGPEVTEPIRLHVAAKRYLCAVDPSYLDGLSPASRLSLSVQGGPMGAEERAAVREQPRIIATPSACGTGTTRPRCPAWTSPAWSIIAIGSKRPRGPRPGSPDEANITFQVLAMVQQLHDGDFVARCRQGSWSVSLGFEVGRRAAIEQQSNDRRLAHLGGTM